TVTHGRVYIPRFGVAVCHSRGRLGNFVCQQLHPPMGGRARLYFRCTWVIFGASDLKVFASQHQSDLIDAKKYRHRECGSIISVSALDCDLCYRFVEGARALVEKGFTQEVVDELFGTLIGVTLESKELCGYALGKDCGAPYNPAAMWNVTLPDTPKPPIIPPKPPKFDYVLFTGDIPAHNVWNQTRGDQTVAMSTFTHYMKTYLPKKMMFPTLGNHESAPVNRGGYYSVSPFLGLRVISLNMNMCNNGNWWLFINATDPGNMLQWFIKELQAAEDKGEKVHVLGHIYPGCSCCLKPWSWNYYKIQVQDYTNYFLNLTDANLNGNPTWQKEYSAKETYGLTSLFPKDWNDLIYRMKTDNTLFNKFCSHTAKSAPNTSCDRNSTLCGLKTGRNGDPNLCRDI
ncbi:ASM-like protein, partial [Mya arenaria]